jgi:phage I-like protein
MTSESVQARLAATLLGIVIDEGLPRDIQWMPPGKCQIVALKNGKPADVTTCTTPATAQRLNFQLQAYRAKAERGVEDRPFIDFNHEDAAAAAHPIEFYWAGDDPKTGGIRCKLEWTKPGAEAISGRAFRRFSPSFSVDDSGNVTVVSLNMGGLVNKAAYKGIEPIWAMGSDEITDPPDEVVVWGKPAAVTLRPSELVTAALYDGRIPYSMTAIWTSRISADCSYAELLLSLPAGRFS